MRSQLHRSAVRLATLCLVAAIGAGAAPAVASAASQQTLGFPALTADGVAVNSAGDVFATTSSAIGCSSCRPAAP